MANKYHRLKKQYSLDGGNTWYDVTPYEYIKGSQMSDPDGDCTNVEWKEVADEYICTENGGYVPTPEYRWVADPDGKMCFNGSLYNTLVGEYSTDGGMTWQPTGATMTNEIIEPNSSCCDGNTYICEEIEITYPEGYDEVAKTLDELVSSLIINGEYPDFTVNY